MDIQPVFAAYFLALIGIAFVGARRMHEMSDYVLAGRKMSTFTSALSASSSSTSGWTMPVFPALAFSDGAVHLWTVMGLVSGAWFSWTILGKAAAALHDSRGVAHAAGLLREALRGRDGYAAGAIGSA